MKSSYKFKFFLNASHTIKWQDGQANSQPHAHTYELVCEVELKKFRKFDDVEGRVRQVLDPLEGQFLNELDYFKQNKPTLESLSYYLFEKIDDNLSDLDCQLLRLEAGESPTRYFCLQK